MRPKRFQSQNFSLFMVKFKKLGFSAPLNLKTQLCLFRIFYSKYLAMKSNPENRLYRQIFLVKVTAICGCNLIRLIYI